MCLADTLASGRLEAKMGGEGGGKREEGGGGWVRDRKGEGKEGDEESGTRKERKWRTGRKASHGNLTKLKKKGNESR